MYTSFRVKNFRCLSSIHIDKLARINLVTGQNNSGKTAILESMFLGVGHHNAMLPTTVNVLRGMTSFLANEDDVWGWLFHNKDTQRPIQIESVRTGNQKELLSIELANTQGSQTILPGVSDLGTSISSTAAQRRLLVLRFSSATGEVSTATARIEADGKITGDSDKVSTQEKALFVTGKLQPVTENASRYGLLEKFKKERGFLEYVRRIDPTIQRLSVINLAGNPTLHADVGLNEMIPIQYLGEGISRLLTFLLAVYDTSGGMVLIDEIDIGIHHSRLAEMWRVLREAALELDCQLVATTHSFECIQAAAEVFESDSDETFVSHRIEPNELEHKVYTLHPRELSVAMEHYLEVR